MLPAAGRQPPGSAAGDDLTYLREYEHVTLARLLLAEHAGDRRPDEVWTRRSGC